MCKTGACKDQFHDLFTVDSYTSAAGVNSTFHLGATARCYEPSACGRITLAEPMPLDADGGLRTCVGTIYATATNVPTGTSTGIFSMASSSLVWTTTHSSSPQWFSDVRVIGRRRKSCL